MYADLNVLWNETTRGGLPHHLATYSQLGYDAVALNHVCTGKLPKGPCPIERIEYQYNGRRKPLRQYTRLTLILDNPQQNYGVNMQNDIIRSYDLLAIQPTTDKMLQNAIQSLHPDIISIDISQSRLPCQLKHGLARQAIDKGIYFELAYGPALNESNRRNVISNARMISRVTKGRHTFLACSSNDHWSIRAPSDVVALAELFGVAKATGVVSAVPKECLKRAGMKRMTLGGVAMMVGTGEEPAPASTTVSTKSDFANDFIQLI